jgi:flagellar biosynthesis protein FlhG
VKRIEEQTHYEVLEVSPTATPKEIQRAYEHAKETFDIESLAVYSLFSEGEVKRIRAAVDGAYRVLMDETLRKSYDQSHLKVIGVLESEKTAEAQDDSNQMKSHLPFTEISVDVGEGPYRGKRLKEIREKLGFDLGTINKETKINVKILEWIEEEIFEKLPALVYLKGFLKGYARSLGLDPQRVVEDYLSFMTPDAKKSH